MLLVDVLQLEAARTSSVKTSIQAHVVKAMKNYEAELFQDRYLPEYQRQMRELSRREKEEAEAKRKRDQQALDRVSGFSESEE